MSRLRHRFSSSKILLAFHFSIIAAFFLHKIFYFTSYDTCKSGFRRPMGWQVHAAPNDWDWTATRRVGSGVADWPPAQPPIPFIVSSPGCRLREESIRRFRRLGAPLFISKWTLTVHMTFFYHSYIFLLATKSLHSVQTTWEHVCISELLICTPNVYLRGTSGLNDHLSSGYLPDCKKNKQTYLKNTASRAFKTLTKLILICSKLHWLVHPTFYLCWVSFFLILFVLFYCYSFLSI